MAAAGVKISDSTMGGVVGGVLLLLILLALLVITVKVIRGCKFKRKDSHQGSKLISACPYSYLNELEDLSFY